MDDIQPTDWQIVTLADLGEVNRGRSRHRPRYAEHLYGGLYPFIQTGDIRNANGWITHHTQTYSAAGLAQSRLWPAGTMCITIAANIAETAILTYPACFPDSVVGFIADESKCDIRFVEFMFRVLKGRLQQEAIGTVQDNINLRTLADLEFLIPPLPEQRAIAHILGTLDDKIELNRRMNQTLEEMARALFHSWFIAFDPVRAKAAGRQPAGMDAATAALFPGSFEESEQGDIPEVWTIEPLSALFSIAKGGVWGNDEPSDDASVPAIALRGIDCHRLAGREDIDVAPRFFTVRQLSGREVSEGSIFVEGSGSNCGRSLLWLDRYTDLFQHPVTYSNFVKRLDPISCDGISFVAWQQIRRAYEEGELAGYRTGTAFPNFDVRGMLASFQVVVPPKPIAERYFEFYRLLMRTDLIIQSRALTTLRDSLLPKLLSGEIRVADASEQVERAAVGIA